MKKKMPKEPKARKLPKKPKASASAQTWRNYDKRVKDTEAANKQRHAEWKRKCEQIKREEHERQALIRKYKR